MQEPSTPQQLSPVPTSEVSVFSGQGIASGQLAELRRVVALPLVREFVQDLSCLLGHEVERTVDEKSHRRYLSQGLDIAEWATAKGAGPDMEYLNGPVVPLVLTFVVQLAVFKYCWLRSNSPHIQVWASAGHSCGMAAAMVVALSTDAPSFAAHSRRFALLLLHFSLSAATSSCALLDASPATSDASPPNANVSFALAVLKIDVAEVRCQVETFNQSLPGGPSLHTRVDVVVLNGAKACTVVGSPTALSAFEPQLQQLQNVTTRRLPVSLPFHSEWLDDAAARTIDSNLHENTPASSLVRPLFSCVDGRMLTQDDQQVPSLEAFLIRILATWPVDWPAAVQSIASHASGRSTRFVDYGPGGGSSALRMSSVIAAECGIADMELDYFSQHHCSKGALPQSWLAWLKQSEDESRLVSSAKSSAKVTQSTKKARNFVWFSDRLKIATNSAMKIDFCSRVLDAISLELDKVQAGRDKAMLREYPAHLETHIRSSEYRLLSQETTRSIDTARYPFCAVLCNLLQLEVPLHRLHHLFHGDQGSKRDRRQKTELMQPLRVPVAREQFVRLFETFNLEQLAPLVCDALGCDRFIFQSCF